MVHPDSGKEIKDSKNCLMQTRIYCGLYIYKFLEELKTQLQKEEGL